MRQWACVWGAWVGLRTFMSPTDACDDPTGDRTARAIAYFVLAWSRVFVRKAEVNMYANLTLFPHYSGIPE